MNEAERLHYIKAMISSSTLPDGYTWGEWSGTYRSILRDGVKVCCVGGLIAQMTSCPTSMNLEIQRSIAKGERERAPL